MKNKFIINNTSVNFEDLINIQLNTDVTNTLIHDFNKFSIFLSKSEIEEYIYNSENIINLKLFPLNSQKNINELFTNLTKKYFITEPVVNRSALNFNTIVGNNNLLCDLDIEYICGNTEYENVTNLKNELYKTFKSSSIPQKDRFIYPISNGGSGQYGAPLGEGNEFNLYCKFKKPTLINTYSLEMYSVYLKNDIVNEIKTNPTNLSELCTYENIYKIDDEIYLPRLFIKIFGRDEISNEQILLNNNDHFRGATKIKYQQDSSHDFQMQNRFSNVIAKNIIFENSKNYLEYKMSVMNSGLNAISYQNFNITPSNIQSEQTVYDCNPNNYKNRMSTISDVKQIGYNFNNNNNKADDLITNIKIYNDLGITKYKFQLNTLYKGSYKYGNLITGLNIKLVTYNMADFKSIDDSTILETLNVEILNILDPIEFNFENYQMSDLTNITNYNIEFEILYDLTKYENLFKNNLLEVIKVNQLMNNYDFNFKLPNKSSVSTIQPKELITYESVAENISDITKTISKSSISLINIPTNVSDITITMTNKQYGDLYDYPSSYYGFNRPQVGYNASINYQAGLLEVAQCDGTQILKTEYTNGISSFTLNNNINRLQTINKLQLAEKLDQSEPFEFIWDRKNNSNLIYNSVKNINLSHIIILPTTKYLIIKLLLKPNTSYRTFAAYNIMMTSIYKTITMSYVVHLKETTFSCNNISEFDSLINNKNVAFYKFDRGVKI